MLMLLANAADHLSFFNVFRYITFRTGGALITSALLVFLLGPRIIDSLRVRQGRGQPIRADGPQTHFKKAGTPTMGGLMILFGTLASVMLWGNLKSVYVWVVLLVTISFGAIGFYDDYLKVTKQSDKGFSGKARLGLEFIIAAIAAYVIMRTGQEPFSSSLTFPFLKGMLLDLSWFFIPFAAFVMVGSGNAVNFTDGLDGLAIVPVMVAAASFGFIAYLSGNAILRITCKSILCRAPVSWLLFSARLLVPVWVSSGSTLRLPRSLWVIPVRLRWAVCWVRLRLRPSTKSCWQSSAACSLWKHCR